MRAGSDVPIAQDSGPVDVGGCRCRPRGGDVVYASETGMDIFRGRGGFTDIVWGLDGYWRRRMLVDPGIDGSVPVWCSSSWIGC